jgi:hypothetical protein
VDPEIETTRIQARKRFSMVFERLVQQGVETREFRAQDIEVSAVCIVGAFIEALVGPIAPGSKSIGARSRARLATSISQFCLNAVKR